MATKKSKIGIHPRTVEFPQLRFGELRAFQRIGLAVCTAVAGNAARKDAMEKTLKAMLEFLNVRYKDDVQRKEAAAEAKAKAAEEALAKAEAEAEAARVARVAALKAELADLEPAEDAE